MPSHVYHADLDGGYSDSDINHIRRKAIEHLWDNRDRAVVIVYTSHTRKKEYGRVIYTASWPIFVWKPSKGRSGPLGKDGTLRRC